MKIFFSETHKQHQPPFEIFDGGEKIPYFEVAERIERITDALSPKPWAHFVKAEDFDLKEILAVHDEEYIHFLQTAFQEWSHTEPESEYEKTALLPATFPTDRRHKMPQTILGKAGWYISDLSAPIVQGTFLAAVSSANCALSGARAVLEGERSAFALCRPPGHHAGKASCAGYCYINNAAVAANWLAGFGKTAILDIDYHAGNGTEDIFYERSDVLTLSIHADPAQDYPYFSGYASETGEHAGLGCHHNFPLPAGAQDKQYLQTLEKALKIIQQAGTERLVLSAGMDIYAGDPLGNFQITTEGINNIGKKIAELELPTLIVMEGGYNNSALGENMVALLEPLA